MTTVWTNCVTLYLRTICLGLWFVILPMTKCGSTSQALLMPALGRPLRRGGWLGSSRLFDKGIAEPRGSLGMVIGATFPLGPLLTDCLMTRLNKRWMRSRSNLVHVPFDILLTYFVPIMFSRFFLMDYHVLNHALTQLYLWPLVKFTNSLLRSSIFCISSHIVYVVNLNERFIYYHCFLYIATISYISCMLFLIHVDLTVEYFLFFGLFKSTWYMNPIVLLINS